jgi:hypothetical protein
LYWLAWHFLPGVGLVHIVYLFNVLVSAAACVVLFLYALTLGYDERVGVIAALLLGVGTIVWPYSKTFFQEPVTLLLVLLTALLLEKWRQSRYRAIFWLALGILAGIGAFLSKMAAVLALPGLIILAAPALFRNANHRQIMIRVVLLLAVVLLIAGLVVSFAGPLGISGRVDRLMSVLRRPGPYVGVALHSYLLSIGGSVWGTSPVLLLALPGAGVLLKRRAVRYPLALIVMLLTFALVYAFWQGDDWFGGLSWPPRFLIPVVPFGLIVAFPVIEKLTRRPVPPWMLAAVLALGIYAVWVQLSGVTLWWREYSRGLPPEANGLGEWGGGLNMIRYLRWVVIPSMWCSSELDFAWVRVNAVAWPLLFGLMTVACGVIPRPRIRHGRHKCIHVARTLIHHSPASDTAASGARIE